jgi:hypothetical protein
VTDQRRVLEAFLRTDPADVGCEETMEVLHIYAEVASSREEKFAGVAAHLAACGPCSEDFAGLLAALHTAPHA